MRQKTERGNEAVRGNEKTVKKKEKEGYD